MTELFMDGFAHYGTGAASVTNMLDGVYAEVDGTFGYACAAPSWDSTGQLALKAVLGGTGATCRRVFPTAQTTLYWSMRFAVDALPSTNNGQSICDLRDSTNTVIATLVLQSTGVVALLKALGGTVLSQTQGPVVVAQNFHFLEMFYDNATSAFTLRVDDSQAVAAPAIQATGLAFGGSGAAAQMGLLSSQALVQGFPNSYVRDLFVRNSAGAVNNGWLGDRRIATLLADADTTTTGWTPRFYQEIGAGILNDTTANACVSAATATSLNVGAGDFTIETFVRFQTLPGGSSKAAISGKWDETANQRSYQLFLGSPTLNGGALCFQTSTDGTPSTVQQPIVYPWAPSLDRWYHVALVRASGELLLFVDGQQLGLPIADSRTYFAGAAPLGIGGQVETVAGAVANTSVDGWFDETRFTVGFARYTANFTPPTVALPRGAANDLQWASVALLCGYDSLIQDESSFNRALTARNGAVQQTVFDGPAIGSWSTVGKAAPDDNTFMEAPFLIASSILTLNAQPAANNTVRVGTKDGAAAAVYTFKAAVTAAYDVLIDTSLQQTLQNLYNAINAGPGAGSKYGIGTNANFDVNAIQLPAGQMQVSANVAGTAGNAIATSATLTNGGGWTGATLAGGVNIPSPSDFKVQRPPPLTTIISAVQIVQRAFKSDAGTCSVNSALVGGLGGVTSAAAHNLTVSPNYYGDTFNTDPDTGAAITPATLINGRIRLNRAT